jgi:hypothetical protein
LKFEGLLADYPDISPASFRKRSSVSEQTIKHELAIMDVKTAFTLQLREKNHFELAEFSTWPLLCQFKVKQKGKLKETTLKPDGFIRIHEKEADGSLSEHAFFLEVDRGTETLKTLLQKAICYNLYYRTGGYAIRCGGSASEFKEYPFRVLMVLHSQARLENIKKMLSGNNPPIVSQVILRLMDNALSDSIESTLEL